jgi:hypothetical protein
VAGRPELRLQFTSLEALRAELSSNLRKGRAFVDGVTAIAERTLCDLVIEHPVTGRTHCLVADVVWVKPDASGVGVQFSGWDAAAVDALQAFVEAVVSTAEVEPEPESADDRPGPVRTVHDRIRRLTTHERDLVARQGSLPERVALERHFGSAVWEPLLANPNLTPPEVMRIAKNGHLPQPLVTAIVSNGAWLTIPEVQRALLSNPRVSGPNLERVLRALSPADLARVAQQTNYPAQTRLAAKRIAKK